MQQTENRSASPKELCLPKATLHVRTATAVFFINLTRNSVSEPPNFVKTHEQTAALHNKTVFPMMENHPFPIGKRALNTKALLGKKTKLIWVMCREIRGIYREQQKIVHLRGIELPNAMHWLKGPN